MSGKKEGAIRAALPYIFLGGVAYLGYRYLSQKTNLFTIVGGAGDYVHEIVKTTTETITETKDAIIEGADKVFDIQKPSEMTETQQTALENYKKGNVTTKTVADPNSLYAKLFINDTKPTKMTDTQQTALENYKKGNVTTKTVADPNSLHAKLFINDTKPTKMTDTQQTALENYKKGDVTTKTVADPNSLYANLFIKDTKSTKKTEPQKISITSLPSIPADAARDFEAAMQIYKNPPHLPETKISVSSSPSIPATTKAPPKAPTKAPTPAPTTVKASSGGYSVAKESGTTVQSKYEPIKVNKKK